MIGMLTRRATVASAWMLVLLAVPVVWLIGYQDHPWREPNVAIVIGLVASVAGVAVHVAGRKEDPLVPRVLTLAAIGASVVAFGCASFWAWIG